MVGISPRKVERARTVLEHAETEIKEAARPASISSHRVHQVFRDKRKFNCTADRFERTALTWNGFPLRMVSALPKTDVCPPDSGGKDCLLPALL